jgi:hypothetical protein|tara:strand:- start:16771 stop:16920 length:150 start_codon:yes stop_codon:yes gene_type:complete
MNACEHELRTYKYIAIPSANGLSLYSPQFLKKYRLGYAYADGDLDLEWN